MDELHRRVADRIRRVAGERGIALSHLADRASVSRTQLWYVLRGKSSPTLEWLQKIAAVLNVRVIDLLQADEGAAAPAGKRPG
jgi:transcriptional regulator with XRE-family HTH domain